MVIEPIEEARAALFALCHRQEEACACGRILSHFRHTVELIEEYILQLETKLILNSALMSLAQCKQTASVLAGAIIIISSSNSCRLSPDKLVDFPKGRPFEMI